MELFTGKKSKEFWGLIAAAGVCYGLSLLFKAGDLQNILVVVSAALFIIALYRLKRNW